MRHLVPAATLAALAGLALGGCSRDPQERYCETVEHHQAALTEVAASDDPGAVFDALDAYVDLAEQAPRDISDDWAAVVDPLRALERVLAEHDVDPSDYSADTPPGRLDDAARAEIEAAARDVGSEQAIDAMAAVEQHALDVCGTPLSR
ncbi:hypothetical protein GCM10011376_33000 [Nocardioides flavus (ex Wang et al. 2016)]|uniref:Uncharacterized protein n=1 Tax=Nocardioides flavus (ex Wang et al. 2016) TaxID=2058780 RepID=A0ABQ3HS48_9ACTN|nr:hypothetical protein [Nocardioides flavus (ex Wang et al. 2016)]GHE18690.1 hypothetical protein GCM10011376_33000 [Nocardioides flavus (ex Wang et al. 2016)]